MINGLYILDENGASLMHHAYLSNVSLSSIKGKLNSGESSSQCLLPVTAEELMYVKVYKTMTFVMLVGVEAPVIEVEEILNQFIFAVESYFEVKFSPFLLKNNKATIVLIYAVMLDTGVPRVMEPDIIRLLVQENSVFSKMFQTGPATISSTNTSRNSAQPSYELLWRRKDVKHANEELLVDILESIECMHATSPSIQGEIFLKSRMNGLPETTIELDRPIESLRFHRSVDLKTYHESNNKVIKLIPPDGFSRIACYSAPAAERFLLHASIKRNANGSFCLNLATAIDTKIESVQDLKAEIVFPEGVHLVKELSSTAGNFNVSNPNKCELSFEKSTPTGWKSSLSALATDTHSESVYPLYANVSYSVQGKCISGVHVRGIRIENKQTETGKSYRGVRYRHSVNAIVK